MAKDLRIGSEGRAKLKAGIDTLANTVKVTLGPKGRNVILDKKFGPPQVCSDGVTIAKEIDLEDPFENMGAQLIKEASKKTNDDAGDGTTTSTVLSQAIVGEGFKNVAAGADPMAIKKGLELGLESVRKSITKLSTPVEGKEQIAQVATLSAHDDEMGSLIANVMEKTGKDGVITVDEGKGLEYETDYVEGCSTTGVIFKIIVPLIRPGIFATLVFCFIMSWNEFLIAYIFTRKEAITAPVGVARFITERQILWGYITAGATLASILPMLLLIIFQKNLIRGLTLGAVK